MFKVGDLINNGQGSFATVLRGPYTHRFMEAQDYEMEANGMGDLAGIYCSAYDIVYMNGDNQGLKRRIRSRQGGWRKVQSEQMAGDKSAVA
ncbi:MAG: hypothetical protein CME70_18875 [Halobacteriovorax sp.]|nr:hypothetical protein [Halobacteriovorax sp.]|tara:strand:- start:213 stop:485 length:273 start_codon:yes stop_codon:yes gene_type:complete